MDDSPSPMILSLWPCQSGISSECFFIDPFDILPGRLSRVGGHAGIVHRILCKLWNVLFCYTQISQCLCYSERVAECCYARNDLLFFFSKVQVIKIHTKCSSDIFVPHRARGEVECDDMLQQQCITFPVGEVRETSKTVSHGMDCAETGIGECKAGKQAPEHRLVPVFGILRVFCCRLEMGVHQP